MAKTSLKRLGSNLDDLLKTEGAFGEVEAQASLKCAPVSAPKRRFH
jgi:hypothetical protein